MKIELFQIEYRDFQMVHSDWEIHESDITDLTQADQNARAFAEDNPDIVVRVIGSIQDYVVGYKFKYADNSLYQSNGNGWIPYEGYN